MGRKVNDFGTEEKQPSNKPASSRSWLNAQPYADHELVIIMYVLTSVISSFTEPGF